jgi:hypothetical protein
MTDIERYELKRNAKLHEAAITGVFTPGWCAISEYEYNRSKTFTFDGVLDCDSFPKRHQDRFVPSDYRLYPK